MTVLHEVMSLESAMSLACVLHHLCQCLLRHKYKKGMVWYVVQHMATMLCQEFSQEAACSLWHMCMQSDQYLRVSDKAAIK